MVWSLGLGVLWLAIVLVVAEAMRRRHWEGELVRKFVHIATGNIIWLAWGFAYPLWACLAVCIPFVIVTLLSYRLPLLQSINSIGRRSWGTFYYALSITLLVAFFWTQQLPQFAVLGILVMTWGDALAALVGQRWGRWHYVAIGDVHKTVEGSLVMAGVSTLVSLVVLSMSQGFSWSLLLSALIIGVVATGLEVFSVGGIDNLSVPLGSALLAWWLVSA